VITSDKELLLTTPQRFKERFNIHVETMHNVNSIDRAGKEFSVTNKATGETSAVKYDKLVLATGARPIKPDIPGIELPGVFTLKTIPDAQRISEWISSLKTADGKPTRAIVIGGGFIGLEMCENLHARS
jgi:NADPH-dependent 2,4-dienoyl-CoA reductase/sulfur reductase-like enzyme